jgi:hypothetical protein
MAFHLLFDLVPVFLKYTAVFFLPQFPPDINMAIKYARHFSPYVIPAKAGIHGLQGLLDSGLPLRASRNDIFNCRLNTNPIFEIELHLRSTGYIL